MAKDDERVLVNAEQLRTWAQNLRSIANRLSLPGEVAAGDQYLASLPDPDNPSLEELEELGRIAGGVRWISASNLRMIAEGMDEAVRYGRP